MKTLKSTTRGPSLPHARCRPSAPTSVTVASSSLRHTPSTTEADFSVVRRSLLAVAPLVLMCRTAPPAQASSDFTTTPSGLQYQDIKVGDGPMPSPGDQVSVHWAGYTKNYQSKRIDNTSKRDEPYEMVMGSGEAIPAFEEAISTMRVGAIRRVIVPGEHPELSYPRDRNLRYDGSRYRLGPQPAEFDGQRALDFVLDNGTLDNTNRTLLFDIKLLAVRKRS